MNIFGIGGPEFIAILIIMLVFVGPKRMIHWSYILGQYVAKFRQMWAQTVDVIQKEFDDAGIDVKLPKDPPTRQNLNQSIKKTFEPLTKPIQDTVDEVGKDLEAVKSVSNELKKPIVPAVTDNVAKPESEVAPQKANGNLGTWSSTTTAPQPDSKPANLGTWSSVPPTEE